MAAIFVPDRLHDLRRAQICFLEEPRRFIQSFIGKQLAEGLAEQSGNSARKVLRAVPEYLRKLGQRRARVALGYVGRNRLFEPRIGGGNAQSAPERFAVIGEVGKEKGNDLREDRAVVGGVLGERIDKVVRQVAHGEAVRRGKIQVFPLAVLFEIPHEEAAHDGVVAHIAEHLLQKIVRHDKIDAYVLLPRLEHAVADVAV